MGIEDFKPKSENLEESDSTVDRTEINKINNEKDMENEVNEILSSKENAVHLIKDEKKLADKIGIPVWMLNVIIAVILLCLVCLGFLTYGYYATITITTYKEVSTVKNITTEIKGFSKNTFGKYILDADRYNGKDVEIYGFLSESSNQKGENAYLRIVLVDDLGNTITLENADDYKIFVPAAGLSESLYNIKGTFRKEYTNLIVDVKELKPTLRQEAVIDSKVEEKISAEMIPNKTTVPKYPFMHNCACSKYDASDPEINFRYRICSCDKQEFIFDIADYDY